MTSPLFHLTCLPHVRCGFIVFKLIFMWKVVRLLISVYKSRGESTKIWCDTYKNLPSQSGNKVYKWLFPSIHFYCSDASYDFTHGPDPVVCESCSLTPEGTDVRWASVITAQLSSAAAEAAGGTGRDQGSMIPYSSSVLTSQAGPSQSANGEKDF